MARLATGVRKKGNGFEKRFSLDGKRYSICAGTLRDLELKEKEVRERITQGIYIRNRDLTLDIYFEEWIVERRKSIKGCTIMKYSLYYRKYIKDRLGKYKVKDIEPRQIKQLQTDLQTNYNLAIGTVNLIMKVLKIILNDAVRDEIIMRSPAASLKSIKDTSEKAVDTIHRALTKEEQKSFMEEMQNDFYYEFVAILLATGMRQGEAAALTWRDIDHKNGVLHITKTRTVTEQGRQAVGSPKTKASIRDIPLTEEVKEILESQRKKMLSMSGIIQIDGKVFQTNYGHMIESQQVNRAIERCLENLAKKGIFLDHFTAHGLRDTFATRAIESGMNPQTLKNILGHNSLAMTMDLYAHVLPDTKAEEMNKMKLIHIG